MLDRRTARLLTLALVALILFHPPILVLVDRIALADVPLLPFYLFSAWALVIGACAVIVERAGEGGE